MSEQAMKPGGAQPFCPRCGYDQSGAVAGWTDRCPLQGNCPECGQAFEWADLRHPGRRDLPWYAEHAARGWQVPGRLPGTVLRMLWPPCFWRRVGVQTRIAPGRLMQSLLWAWLLVWLIGVLPIAVLCGVDRSIGWWQGWVVGPMNRYLAALRFPGWLTDLVSGFLMPHGYLEPSFAIRGIGWRYGLRGHGASLLAGEYQAWCVPITISLTWLLLMGLLPVTRRMAQVRSHHLFRVCFAGMIPLVVFWGAWRVAMSAHLLYSYHHPPLRYLVQLFGADVMILWTSFWWGCALRVGWGIRSWSLIALGSLAAFLAAVLIHTMIDLVWQDGLAM